ncbi:MAG TPA: hypothetical protein VFY29_12160 [Terriglobia bacterium]|nr:hypothetical protein [Terriglobia bacterium]
MKRYWAFSLILVCLAATEAFPQIRLRDLLGIRSALSEREAGQGIKEALTQGVTKAVLNLNKTD